MKETIEIGSGVALKLQEFVEEIKHLTQSQSQLLYGAVARRLNEPAELKADISKLQSLGWGPKVSIREGLAETIKHFRN